MMSFQAYQPLPFIVEYSSESPGVRTYYADAGRDRRISRDFAHRFCGPNNVLCAVCPNCDLPLLQFLELDASDPRLGLVGLPQRFLYLLYCWRCPVSQEVFYYRLVEEGGIEILRFEIGSPEKNWPYRDYPLYFPGASVALLQLSNEAQNLIKRLNQGEYDEWALLQDNPELNSPIHQYGGEPYLVQQDTEYEVRCPVCAGLMPFLASIGDDCLDPRGFVSNDYVQVLYHYCRNCQVIGAFNQCD